MSTRRISKSTVDSLFCPPGKDRDIVWDDKLKGFGVIVYPTTGLKTYVAQSLRTPAKFTRSRGPLVADEERDRPLADPRSPDAENRERLPRRAGVMAGPDKSQLALRDRQHFLRRRRERAADVRRKPRGRVHRLEVGSFREHDAAHFAVA